MYLVVVLCGCGCVFLCYFFFLMIRRPPRSTQGGSSAASVVYKGQVCDRTPADPRPPNHRHATNRGKVNRADPVGTKPPPLGKVGGGAMFGGLALIHTSEPTRQAESLYAVFCVKKKKNTLKLLLTVIHSLLYYS